MDEIRELLSTLRTKTAGTGWEATLDELEEKIKNSGMPPEMFGSSNDELERLRREGMIFDIRTLSQLPEIISDILTRQNVRSLLDKLKETGLDTGDIALLGGINKELLEEITNDQTLTRQGLIAGLEWNNGGCGFGITPVAASMAWAMDAPNREKPDLRSIVAVSGPPDKYTDQELAKIAAFAQKATAQYDRIFRYRRGANLILFDKVKSGMWLRKRLTWSIGPMFSESLDEAIGFMSKSVFH